jgi:hypothetical protein
MRSHYLWLLNGLLFWTTTGSAQIEPLPRDEYKLIVSKTAMVLLKGQQDSVKISILRSRSFKTGKASMTLAPLTQPGLTMSMKQLPGAPDEYMVYVSASADANTGEYNFIPTCTLRNKTKGTVLKLIIN